MALSSIVYRLVPIPLESGIEDPRFLPKQKSGDSGLLIMFHLYILELNDKSYYVGSTGDLEDRMKKHRNKQVKSTKNKLPFELKYIEQYNNRSDAQTREYQIKKWKSRKAIERLMNTKKK